MKRIFFVAFILVVMTVTAFGQINIRPGITGGWNFATLGGSDVPNVSTITQYAAGVFAEISFPFFPISIQPEVLYSVKGSKIGPNPVADANDIWSATKITTSYIDISDSHKILSSIYSHKAIYFCRPIDWIFSQRKRGSNYFGIRN